MAARTLALWLPDELLATDDAAARSRSLLARALVWSTGGHWDDLIEALYVRSMPLRRLDGYVTASARIFSSRRYHLTVSTASPHRAFSALGTRW